MVLNEKQKYHSHTVGTVTKYNRKIVQRGKIDTPNIEETIPLTHVHDRGDNTPTYVHDRGDNTLTHVHDRGDNTPT